MKLCQYLDKRKHERNADKVRINSLGSVGGISARDGEATYQNVEVIVNSDHLPELRGSLKGLAEVFK